MGYMSSKKTAVSQVPATVPVAPTPVTQADQDTLQLAFGPDWPAVIKEGQREIAPAALAAEVRQSDAEKFSDWTKGQSLMVGARSDFDSFPEPRAMSCCRFRGHRDRVFLEPEGVDATTEVQPGVQARGG
jgi:hypothetical protein